MTRPITIALLSVGLSMGVALAQDGGRDVVTDKISVTVVEIPVQVMYQGEPVRDLGPADFEIYDRGRRQEIVSFDVLDLSGADPATRAAADAVSRRGFRSRHLLLLFDVDFTDWRELPRALKGARELLQVQLHPTDRVAVGFYSAFFGVQLLTDFVNEREAGLIAIDIVQAMVDRSPEAAAAGLSALAASTGLTYDGDEADDEVWLQVARKWIAAARQPIGESPRELVALAEATDAAANNLARTEVPLDRVTRDVSAAPDLYDERTLRQVREMGRRLADLVHGLAHIPDPKQIVFLSQGFPSQFLQDRDQSTRVLFRLDSAVRAFLETGWVLQAIDIRGVPDMDEPVFDGNSLFHLAEHSGGELYENFNRVSAATARVLQRTSVTYLLTIQPDVEADGSFHDLEVRLAGGRRGKLSHRPGYRAPRPGDRPARFDAQQDVAELILSRRPLEDFEVDLLAVPVPAMLGFRARVPVVVEVPGEVLLEHPFGDTASVEVHAYGLAPDGGIQDLFIKRVDIDLAREGRRLARGGMRVVGHLDLGVGDNEIRVLVRNVADDALSLVAMPVSITTIQPGDLVVLPPMFIDRSRDWLSIRLTEGPSPQLGVVSTVAGVGEDFFPRLSPSFRHGKSQEVIFNLFFVGEGPRLHLRVLTARGDEVDSAKIRLVQRFVGEGGATGLLATLQAKGLEPGGYRLEVTLVDPISGESASSSQRFRIVEPG